SREKAGTSGSAGPISCGSSARPGSCGARRIKACRDDQKPERLNRINTGSSNPFYCNGLLPARWPQRMYQFRPSCEVYPGWWEKKTAFVSSTLRLLFDHPSTILPLLCSCRTSEIT
ncbi:unnamed protein product, partial [Phaeothamnion confervicola]